MLHNMHVIRRLKAFCRPQVQQLSFLFASHLRVGELHKSAAVESGLTVRAQLPLAAWPITWVMHTDTQRGWRGWKGWVNAALRLATRISGVGEGLLACFQHAP